MKKCILREHGLKVCKTTKFRWARDTYKVTIMINDDELSDHKHISQPSALVLCV